MTLSSLCHVQQTREQANMRELSLFPCGQTCGHIRQRMGSQHTMLLSLGTMSMKEKTHGRSETAYYNEFFILYIQSKEEREFTNLISVKHETWHHCMSSQIGLCSADQLWWTILYLHWRFTKCFQEIPGQFHAYSFCMQVETYHL